MFHDPDYSKKCTPYVLLSSTKKCTEDERSSAPPENRSDRSYYNETLEHQLIKCTGLGCPYCEHLMSPRHRPLASNLGRYVLSENQIRPFYNF